VHEKSKTGSEWYSFVKSARLITGEGWELFGNPYGVTASGDTTKHNSKGDEV
jgi:hypothetical protein